MRGHYKAGKRDKKGVFLATHMTNKYGPSSVEARIRIQTVIWVSEMRDKKIALCHLSNKLLPWAEFPIGPISLWTRGGKAKTKLNHCSLIEATFQLYSVLFSFIWLCTTGTIMHLEMRKFYSSLGSRIDQ